MSKSQKRKPAEGTNATSAAKPQSKTEVLIALLQRKGGATLDDMMGATSWQKHSLRGFIAGTLKNKHGLAVSSEKSDKGRVYRVAGEAKS